jgi:hypothetical protein
MAIAEEAPLQPRITVSPNPASHTLTISGEQTGDQTLNKPWELRLTNQQGTLMRNMEAILPATINLQGLFPGAYILNARQGENYQQVVVLVE